MRWTVIEHHAPEEPGAAPEPGDEADHALFWADGSLRCIVHEVEALSATAALARVERMGAASDPRPVRYELQAEA